MPSAFRRARGLARGLTDPAISKALSIIHHRYAEDLEVEELAREVGVSRSVLGERFTELIGEPPMRYCARWRMRIAANMLREGKENTASIAYAVGFNSEAAFNRAFKREFGVPPATWRRRVEEEERAKTRASASANCRRNRSVIAARRTERNLPIQCSERGRRWSRPPTGSTISSMIGRARCGGTGSTSSPTAVRSSATTSAGTGFAMGHARAVVRGLHRRSGMRRRLPRARAVRPARDQPGRGGRGGLCRASPRPGATAGDLQRLCGRLGGALGPSERARREAMVTLTQLGWGAIEPRLPPAVHQPLCPRRNPEADGLVQRDAAAVGIARECGEAAAGPFADRRPRAAAAGADADVDLPFAQ